MYQLKPFQFNVFDSVMSFIFAFALNWSNNLLKNDIYIFVFINSFKSILSQIPNAQRLRELKSQNHSEYESVRSFFISISKFILILTTPVLLLVNNLTLIYFSLILVAIIQIKLSAITTETDSYTWKIFDNSDNVLLSIGAFLMFCYDKFNSFDHDINNLLSFKIALMLYMLRAIFYIKYIGKNDTNFQMIHIFNFYKTQSGRTGKVFWNLVTKFTIVKTIFTMGMSEAMMKIASITNITNIMCGLFSHWQKEAFVNMSLITKKEKNISIIRYTLTNFFNDNFRIITKISTIALAIILKLALLYVNIEIANFSYLEIWLILFLEHVYIVFDKTSEICGKLISYYIQPKFGIPNLFSKQIPYFISFFLTLFVESSMEKLTFMCKESRFLIFILFKIGIKILELITTFWVIPSLCSLEYVFENIKTNLIKGVQNGLKIYKSAIFHIVEAIRKPFIVFLMGSFILTYFNENSVFNPLSEQVINLYQNSYVQLMKFAPLRTNFVAETTNSTYSWWNTLYLLFFLFKIYQQINLDFSKYTSFFNEDREEKFIEGITKYVALASFYSIAAFIINKLGIVYLEDVIAGPNGIEEIKIKQSYYYLTIFKLAFNSFVTNTLYCINLVLMSTYLFKNYILSTNLSEVNNPLIRKSIEYLQRFCVISGGSIQDNGLFSEQYYLTAHTPYTSEDIDKYLNEKHGK